MNIPQTNRQPAKITTEEIAKLLAKRHPQDATDYYATDPNPDIRQLGRLALRRNDINDLFALGDIRPMYGSRLRAAEMLSLPP